MSKPDRSPGFFDTDTGVTTQDFNGFEIYCDGAAEPNPGAGGWGVVVYRDGTEDKVFYGGAPDQTNNQMELTGMIEAIKYCLFAPYIRGITRIWCDSLYVVNGCNEWRHRWKKHGWRRSRNGPTIKNVELWTELDMLLQKAAVKIEWCRGHSGIKGNERSDELSLIGMRVAAAS